MRGGIDAARETRRNGKSRLAKPARKPLGDLNPRGGSIARPDNSDQRHGQYADIAAERDQWRRIVDHLQPARIVRLAERDQRHAGFAGSLDLAPDLVTRTDARRSPAASLRQVRQCRERRALRRNG